MNIFLRAFYQWATVTGITFVHKPNDDGRSLGRHSGTLGRRGDVPIGGHFVDGNGQTLAYSFFPDDGDMVLDTGDDFCDDTCQTSVRLRNVLTHEVGYGIGLEHICPTDHTKLMVPNITTRLNGPQHKYILAANRGSGDRLEQNDNALTLSDLENMENHSITIDSESIDDDSDSDCRGFGIEDGRSLTAMLSPIEFTHVNGEQSDIALSFAARFVCTRIICR